MRKIALFNHKGGVGKTTLTINIADALADAGKTVLIVDADPQCNITSFYIDEPSLEKLLGEFDENGADATLWSAVKPVVEGRGDIVEIPEWQVSGRPIFLLPGDVLLSDYEEELPAAWTECFARRTRGYDVTTALARVAKRTGDKVKADVVLYDMGPNVGALNRSVLLDCDFFITPVAADLFSLRALTTVGRSVAKWIKDWTTVRGLASAANKAKLPIGRPAYLGYGLGLRPPYLTSGAARCVSASSLANIAARPKVMRPAFTSATILGVSFVCSRTKAARSTARVLTHHIVAALSMVTTGSPIKTPFGVLISWPSNKDLRSPPCFVVTISSAFIARCPSVRCRR